MALSPIRQRRRMMKEYRRPSTRRRAMRQDEELMHVRLVLARSVVWPRNGRAARRQGMIRRGSRQRSRYPRSRRVWSNDGVTFGERGSSGAAGGAAVGAIAGNAGMGAAIGPVWGWWGDSMISSKKETSTTQASLQSIGKASWRPSAPPNALSPEIGANGHRRRGQTGCKTCLGRRAIADQSITKDLGLLMDFDEDQQRLDPEVVNVTPLS